MASQLSESAASQLRTRSDEQRQQGAEPSRLRFVQSWRIDPLAFGSFGFLLMGVSILVFGVGQSRLASASLLLGLGGYLFVRSLILVERLSVDIPSGKLERCPSRKAARGEPLGRCTKLHLGSTEHHFDYALCAELDTGERKLLLRHRHPDRILRSAREVSRALKLELVEGAWQHGEPERPSESTAPPTEYSITPYRSRAILVAALLVTLDLSLLTLIKLRDGLRPGWVTLLVPMFFLGLVLTLAFGIFAFRYRIERSDRIVVERALGPWLRARWEFPLEPGLRAYPVSPSGKRFARHFLVDDGQRCKSFPIRPRDVEPLRALFHSVSTVSD